MSSKLQELTLKEVNPTSVSSQIRTDLKRLKVHNDNIKHFMTGPEGDSEFCFPKISMFLETKSRETLRFEGNKIHCFPRDQSLSDLLYSKANRSNRWKTNNHVIDK